MRFLFLLIFIIQVLVSPSRVSAQLEITDVYDVADSQVNTGDILSMQDQGLMRSETAYDQQLFGVVTSNPLAVYKRTDNSGVAIARTGTVSVNVSDKNGVIKKGDLITSSDMGGIGQKATRSGYVIGMATEDLAGNEGKIPVALKIEYAQNGNSSELASDFGGSFMQNVRDPEKFIDMLKILGVSITDLLTILIGLSILGRVIPKSIEGIGRNPTARKTIMIYTLANVGIVVVVVCLGIAISIFLLRV